MTREFLEPNGNIKIHTTEKEDFEDESDAELEEKRSAVWEFKFLSSQVQQPEESF